MTATFLSASSELADKIRLENAKNWIAAAKKYASEEIEKLTQVYAERANLTMLYYGRFFVTCAFFRFAFFGTRFFFHNSIIKH